MARQRSRVADYLVYVVVRFLVCVLQILSPQQAKSLARLLACLAYRVDRRHRLVALENLRHAFGDRYSEAQREAIVRAVYEHFCTVAIEMVQLPRKMHATTWRKFVHPALDRGIASVMVSSEPILAVTGHLGNWELCGYTMGLFGFHTHAIARPLDNPHLDRFIRQFRERTGQTILAKHGEFEQIQGVLAKGGILGTLADQDAGQRGVFVDYFGRPASTHKAVALLALQYGVKMMVAGTPRVGDRYDFVLGDIIDPREYEGRPDAVRAMTQRFTAALEKLVRLAPEQYFWLHRRWKHQPPKKKAKQKAA
jgi:KDO2-lipid IV(A) lauroyltransferase